MVVITCKIGGVAGTVAQAGCNFDSVDTDANTHIFALYQEVPPGGSLKPWSIKDVSFVDTFFDNYSGRLKIGANSTNYSTPWLWLNNWQVADYEFEAIQGPSANILVLVPATWGYDLSGGKLPCLDTCSSINLLKELIPLRNLCNWNCKLNCSLTRAQLALLMNDKDVLLAADARDRTAAMPVKAKDIIIFSILFTNDNVLAKPIELRLTFAIS